MTNALPSPLPALPGGGATPAGPGANPAAPKVATQRDFSPVLDDAKALIDRRRDPADQAQSRQRVSRRDGDSAKSKDRNLENQDPGKPDQAGPTDDKNSTRPAADDPTSESVRNKQPNAEDQNNSDAPADRETSDQPATGAEEPSSEDGEGLGQGATSDAEDQATTQTLSPALSSAPSTGLPTGQPSALSPALLSLDATTINGPSSPATNSSDGEPTPDTSIDLAPPAGGLDVNTGDGDRAGQIDLDGAASDHTKLPTGAVDNEDGTGTSAPAEVTAVPSDETVLADRRPTVANDSSKAAGLPVTAELEPATSVPAAPNLDADPAATNAVTEPDAAAGLPTEPAAAVDRPESTSTATQASSRTEVPISGNSASSPGLTGAIADVKAAATIEATTAKFDVAGASAATPDLANDETQDDLWGQVQRALTRARSGAEGQELRLRLRPAELGELLIQVRTTGDQLAVRLVTTSGAAHQTLLNDQPRLAAELRSAGFDGGSVDISQQDQQPGDPNQRSGRDSGSTNQPPNASPSAVFASADGRPADRRQTVSVQRPRGGLVDITL